MGDGGGVDDVDGADVGVCVEAAVSGGSGQMVVRARSAGHCH